ncbi:hypothetical protein CEW89_09430 [Celeribacter ethanolicus]|uniref:Uncharacterized protein n=1 Tax=Celeribacter ethanolicus TaxID=1758178 RepID=A0A291GCI4_9RHOB|nr:hypothetical protein [Celeribacter ethanolicus]ATG47764.1 hypothetical protein CEW89_09430 [Celeribacter ethanolicus]
MADRDSEYQEAQNAASSEGGRTAEDGCAHCHTGNWIHIRYEYPNEMPVTDAIYVVQKPNNGEPGGEVIAEGVLTVTDQSQHEFIHVDLGEYSGEVEVFFFDDPTEPEPIEEPAPVEDERAWYEKAATAIVQSASDAASWTGGVLAGDFNEEMSTGQIITNAVVTAIPVVDQVADVRDLVANGKALVWDKRYNEIAVWVGVFACLIGLVPSLGSLAKGVIKVIWRNAGEIGRVLVYINKALFKMGKAPNGYRFVRQLADDVVAQVGFVAGKFDDFLGVLAEKIALARHIMPGKVAEALATLEMVRAMSRQKLDEAAHAIRDKILQGLARHASRAYSVLPAQSIVVRRATKLIIEMGPFPNWERHMGRPGFDASAIEAGARQTADTDRVRIAAIKRSAGQWKNEILADLHAHAKRTGLSKAEKDAVNALIASANHSKFLETLETFGAKPTYRIFQPGDRVYRVISNEGGISGRFWSPERPPRTEAEWRSRDAVRNDWNNGGAYVVADVPPPPAAFEGEIGPQDLSAAGKPGMMLDGGGTQTFMIDSVPPNRIREYWYTEWNAPTSALQAARNAANWMECDL